ncbi:MAG TPA: glycerophosphodiester phosphodiesterase family protein, partial [Gemmatimonadota bacterium]|nr:glycerophosphodiester phosphodiesterase family protein [Gemmatimonadota bacterium]
FRAQGVTIPTLREVLETFSGTPLIIEIKQTEPPIEEDLARLLHETGSEPRALVFSLEQGPLDRYRALGGVHPTGFGPGDVAEFMRRLGSGAWDGYRPPAAAFAVPVRWRGTQIVSAAFTDTAHALGCEVFVWTINEPRAMHALLDLGADGLISDYPERLRQVVAERARGRPGS